MMATTDKNSLLLDAWRKRARDALAEVNAGVTESLARLHEGDAWEDELSTLPEPEPTPPAQTEPVPRRVNPMWTWRKRSR